MNLGNLFSANPLQKLIITLVSGVLLFAAGYAYRWHRDSIADAKVEAKKEVVVKTVTQTVKVTDTQAVSRLKTALAVSEHRAAVFERQLKEYADAHPADPSCRLPERMRDELNDRLAGRGPGPADAVRRTDGRTTDDSRSK